MMMDMTYEEFKRQLGKAGLTAKDFADLVKLNPNSITNYAQAGEVPPHLAIIVALMGEMAENSLDFRPALSKIKIEQTKTRGSPKGHFGGSKPVNEPEQGLV